MSEALLFSDIDESAFFMPPEQTRKRYTSAQVTGIEFKKSAIVLLVSYGCPVEVIARELKLSTRTVGAIASQAGSKVAGFRKEYADNLLRMGGSAFALAATKASEASYLQLMTGAGIATDKAIALAAMGELGEEKTIKETQDHVQAAAAIRRLMLQERSADGQSGEKPKLSEGSGHDVPTGVPTQGQATTPDPAPAVGEGGGWEAGPPAGSPIGPADTDFQPKG